MLEEMDAGQLEEWIASDKLQDEAEQRAELKARAEAGVSSHKRGRR